MSTLLRHHCKVQVVTRCSQTCFILLQGQAGTVKANAFGTPAERMAYFQQAAKQEKAAEPAQPAKPAQPAPKPAAAPAPAQKDKENDNQNKPIEKIARRR